MIDLIGKAKAQVTNVDPLQPIPPGNVNVEGVVITIINFLLFIAGAVAIIYLIYGGVLYITAGGDEAKATKGKTAVINAVIGIAIVLLALVILRLIENTLRGAVGAPV